MMSVAGSRLKNSSIKSTSLALTAGEVATLVADLEFVAITRLEASVLQGIGWTWLKVSVLAVPLSRSFALVSMLEAERP